MGENGLKIDQGSGPLQSWNLFLIILKASEVHLTYQYPHLVLTNAQVLVVL